MFILKYVVKNLIPVSSYNECNIILLIIQWLLYINYLHISYYLHLQLRYNPQSKNQKPSPEEFLKVLQIS